MDTDPICLVFVPALVVILTAAENEKGSPLTEEEVVSIRDKATCIALRFSAALSMEEKRGYPDIVAENCWEQWQQYRERSA
ncbi:hypothetical protein BZK31_18505 [Pseudomonas floridensis]|uniref:Uncharacterized protein n=1 Tax=Pseudomonas floridensis TaxID=1958950 RepID=A0A1X0N474_9PSED|nr:hypothetical protein [Pseudomonas floridensis]ORC57672.1 hypothetical protein BZK31_18505 [Pseudomonas floridensis]